MREDMNKTKHIRVNKKPSSRDWTEVPNRAQFLTALLKADEDGANTMQPKNYDKISK